MIAAIGRCSDSEVTLAALIAFLQGLSLRVRAAGTAADDQLDFLRNHQCDEVTGPLLAPALGAAEIDRLTGIEPCFMQQQWLAGSKPRLLSMH
jgi:EAL domain-containing protein (putative c-di-GMP-specific phosphodiesterase class I)